MTHSTHENNEPLYVLTSGAPTASPTVPLSKAEYERVKSAIHGISRLIEVEEPFFLLIGNYVDLEKGMLEISLEHSCFNVQEHRVFAAHRLEMTRWFFNLLSAGRLYVDHLPRRLQDTYGANSQAGAEFKKATNAQYDASLPYRTFEALRNYAQHNDVPVQRASFISWVDEDGDEYRTKTTVIPYLNVLDLRQDGGFKKSVLKELETLHATQPVELKAFLRDYVSALGRIHLSVRNVTAETQKNWSDTIREMVNRYHKIAGKERSSGLIVALYDSDGKVAEQRNIDVFLLETLEWMQRRTYNLANFGKAIVTSEVYKTRPQERFASISTID